MSAAGEPARPHVGDPAVTALGAPAHRVTVYPRRHVGNRARETS
jgi:hypothetical protein